MNRRAVIVVVLLAWTTPGAIGLGVGAHLLLEHHDPLGHHASAAREEFGDPAPQVDLVALLQVATHGHRHDGVIDSEHRHDARLERLASNGSNGSDPTAVTRIAVTVDPQVGEAGHDRTRRRGPPTPAFTAHSSMLL